MCNIGGGRRKMTFRSSNNVSSPINKLFGQFPFRSEKILKIFESLARGIRLARDLAREINSDSKQIFPRLKRYILRGWIQVQKINNLNVYSLTEVARKILKQIHGSFDKVREKVEHLMARKLDEDEIEILKFFYELNGYVERGEQETIAEQVYYTLKQRIPLSRVTEILTEFTNSKILFAYRLRNGVILKVRLNKNLL
jgi:DNA-binding MarR family transcriptional regulator